MDSGTEQNVRAAIAELNKTGVSYVLMIEDDAGAPSFFYNDPKTHYYLVKEQQDGE